MTSTPTDLRDRIAEALIAWTYRGKDPEHGGLLETVRANAYGRADAVLAVLSPPADRCAVEDERDELRSAWDSLTRASREDAAALVEVGHLLGLSLGERTVSVRTAIEAIGTALRRMADEAQRPEPQTLVHVGWWCWRGNNHGHLTTTACRSDNVPIHVPADWADEMRAVIQRIEDGDDEAQQPETDEQRADREETERDHAFGNHTYCGVTCETEFPTEMLRNGILAKGYPGTAGMLDELLRRARTGKGA